MVQAVAKFEGVLLEYQEFSYISFGKYIYSAYQTVEVASEDAFGLARFPFTLGSFCYMHRQTQFSGVLHCWRKDRVKRCGRYKLLVRPTYFTRHLNPHYAIPDTPNVTLGQIQLDTSEAHIKEWPSIFQTQSVQYHATAARLLGVPG